MFVTFLDRTGVCPLSTDAIKLVEENFTNHGVKETSESLSRNVFRVLNAVALQRSPEETKQTFDLLVTKCKYSPPVSMVLGPLVRSHLLR